jgi:Ser/Thr protein kinase RdoA (MazF antagonist)
MTPGSRAAVDVAEQLGFAVEEPVLIQETNNTVVWLRPHAVIAKVATRPESIDGLLLEHGVASALDRLGAPVAAPLPEVSPVRHPHTGFVVTLWQRLDHDPNPQPSGSTVGRSLRSLHDALSACDVELPNFRDGLERTRRALFDDRRISALRSADRTFLRTAFEALVADVEKRTLTERALHGEPHDSNFLLTSAGLRWIDFEATCRGPLEWDLAFLGADACTQFRDVDNELLNLLRTLNSARVATWCWVRYQYPDMRWHAHHHLEVVRQNWPTHT